MESAPLQFPEKKDESSRKVPASDLEVGWRLKVYGKDSPLALKEMHTASDGSITLFLEGGATLKADGPKDPFEVVL